VPELGYPSSSTGGAFRHIYSSDDLSISSAHSPCTIGAFAFCLIRRIRLLICFGAFASFIGAFASGTAFVPLYSFGAFARISRRIRRIQSTHPLTHMSAHSPCSIGAFAICLLRRIRSANTFFGAFARTRRRIRQALWAHSPTLESAFAHFIQGL
jgi:hypothetical protein